jgi:serralysin
VKRLGTALAILTLALGSAVLTGPAQASHPANHAANDGAKGSSTPPTYLGPGDAGVSDIGNQALVRKSKWGYVYIAGQQNTHMKITVSGGAIHYVDQGTQKIKSLVKGCKSVHAKKGIAISCHLPKKWATNMFVQVWPRLGNDYVDGHTLSAGFRLWDLADAGNDTMIGGAGDDFFNGAKGNDTAYGNGGDDWLRGGDGTDKLDGGPGNNQISEN